MDSNLWDRVQELKSSINGGVEPMEHVRLKTQVIRMSLGMYLTQTIIVALWWSIKDAVFWPWLFVLSALLQVGWLWSKATEYWKQVRAGGYQPMYPSPTDVETGMSHTYAPPPPPPPTINIQNEPITGRKSRSVLVELDTDSARDSIIDT